MSSPGDDQPGSAPSADLSGDAVRPTDSSRLDDIRRRADLVAVADARLRRRLQQSLPDGRPDKLSDTDPDGDPDSDPDSVVRRPSLLPGWTVGHVLTHLAQNADGLRRLLTGARTGVETPMYPASVDRDADVAAGALRSGQAIVAGYLAAADALAADIRDLPDPAWDAPVRTRTGSSTPADAVLDHRLAEILLHHHDLGIDTGLDGLSDELAAALLAAQPRTFLRTHDAPAMTLVPRSRNGRDWPRLHIGTGSMASDGTGPEITGTAAALVGWLTGRTDGSTLTTTTPDGALPSLPTW